MVAKRLEVLTKALDLSAEQQTAIMPILEQEAVKFQEVRKAKLDPAQRNAKLQELRNTSGDQIRAQLTPEQQLKYDALRKEASERHKSRPFNPISKPAK